MEGFFGAIRDSMPDYWGRLFIERRSGHARPEECDYLMEGPDDRASALGFSPDIEPPTPRRRFNATLDLARLLAAVEAVLAVEPRVRPRHRSRPRAPTDADADGSIMRPSSTETQRAGRRPDAHFATGLTSEPARAPNRTRAPGPLSGDELPLLPRRSAKVGYNQHKHHTS